MNAFIRSLFTVLFGWIRSVLQGLWNSLFSGAYHGFFTWLGHSWPFVVIVLCLICTLLDYLVWLVRWRPYILWRQHLRSLFHRRQPEPRPETPAEAEPVHASDEGQPYTYFPQQQPIQRHRRSQR